jgi:hypothetical protein
MAAPKIQFRKDYETFGLLTGNRIINRSKIEKIKEDIESGFNLLPYCPVIVFEKENILYIIDGQHRFYVSKELELPVYYVVSEELNLFQIATMNSKQDKWKEKDFLKCYMELGINDYKILNDLSSEFGVGIAIVAELLMNGKYAGVKDILSHFREGKFVVKFENESRTLLELIRRLFGRYRFSNDRALFKAIQMIREKGLCDFDFLQEKIKQSPNLMDKQTSPKDYIYNIEKVYNHKATIRKVIF